MSLNCFENISVNIDVSNKSTNGYKVITKVNNIIFFLIKIIIYV